MLLLSIFWKDNKIIVCVCPFSCVCYIPLQIQCEITAEIIHTILQYLALNQRHPRDHNVISGITNYANTDLPCWVKLDGVISKTTKKKTGKVCLFFFCPLQPGFQLLPHNYSVGGRRLFSFRKGS